jgi:6-phosphofructokinase
MHDVSMKNLPIGGVGYAAKLNELGVKIIAIPKTMDNDVLGRSTGVSSLS